MDKFLDAIITFFKALFEEFKIEPIKKNFKSSWEELVYYYSKYDKVEEHFKVASMAQFILESGRGTSDLSKKHFNFAGLKWRAEMQGFAVPVLIKVPSESSPVEFCSFTSVENFIAGYWQFIGRSPYKGWEKTNDSVEYLEHLQKSGYAADPNYLVKVKSLLKEARELLDLKNDEDFELPDIEFQGTKVIGLIVGHTKSAPGATFALGGSEYQYNSRVANLAKDYAKKTYGDSVKVEIIFRDGIGISGAYKKATSLKCDVVIELHFNAFNKKASGTETLSTGDLQDRSFSEMIQKMMCDVFKRSGNSRGVKVLSKGDRGAGNIYSFPSGPNCLVEPFFGDNKTEAELGEKYIKDYAQGLIDTCIKYFN